MYVSVFGYSFYPASTERGLVYMKREIGSPARQILKEEQQPMFLQCGLIIHILAKRNFRMLWQLSTAFNLRCQLHIRVFADVERVVNR